MKRPIGVYAAACGFAGRPAMPQAAFMIAVSLGIMMAMPSAVDAENPRPADLRGAGITQRLGEQVPLDLPFRDETGRPVQLRDLFDGKPVILVLAYYRCPKLCNQVLNGRSMA